MSQKPIVMEQLKQILQLKNDGIGIREIARRTGISRKSVRKYLAKLPAITSDENSQELSNKDLAGKAYNNDRLEHDAARLQQLSRHFSGCQAELSKTGVTRQLLSQEYMALHPDGYSYSRYCYHLKQHLKNADVSMHLEYLPADMIMVDFAGGKQRYVDVYSGEVIECQVFVSILPYSRLIFCKAVHSQQTADFTECINSMLKYYARLPATILCDNLRTAVIRPSRYEPVFTDICYQFSEHYATTFSATLYPAIRPLFPLTPLRILPLIKERQSRALDELYCIGYAHRLYSSAFPCNYNSAGAGPICPVQPELVTINKDEKKISRRVGWHCGHYIRQDKKNRA